MLLPTLWLVGDSTLATTSGYGDALIEDLYDGSVRRVFNRGQSGASSRSYYENTWTWWVRESLRPGDWVVIAFGHNDSNVAPEKYTDPGTAPDYLGTYRDFLTLMVSEAEAKGATVILTTPVSRMTFDGSGDHERTHGLYPASMTKLAADRGLMLLDMEQASHDEFQSLGEAATLAAYSDGSDTTHFPAAKAGGIADMWTTLLTAAGGLP